MKSDSFRIFGKRGRAKESETTLQRPYTVSACFVSLGRMSWRTAPSTTLRKLPPWMLTRSKTDTSTFCHVSHYDAVLRSCETFSLSVCLSVCLSPSSPSQFCNRCLYVQVLYLFLYPNTHHCAPATEVLLWWCVVSACGLLFQMTTPVSS